MVLVLLEPMCSCLVLAGSDGQGSGNSVNLVDPKNCGVPKVFFVCFPAECKAGCRGKCFHNS